MLNHDFSLSGPSTMPTNLKIQAGLNMEDGSVYVPPAGPLSGSRRRNHPPPPPVIVNPVITRKQSAFAVLKRGR